MATALSSALRKRPAYAFDPGNPKTYWKDPKTGKLSQAAIQRAKARQAYAEKQGWVPKGKDFNLKALRVGNRAQILVGMGLLPQPSSSHGGMHGNVDTSTGGSHSWHMDGGGTGGSKSHDYRVPTAPPGVNQGSIGGHSQGGGHTSTGTGGAIYQPTGGAAANLHDSTIHAAMQSAGVSQRATRAGALTHALAALQVAMDTESHTRTSDLVQRFPKGSPQDPRGFRTGRQPASGDWTSGLEYNPRRKRGKRNPSPHPGKPFVANRLSSALRSVY